MKLSTGCQAGYPVFWRTWVAHGCNLSCIGPSQVFTDVQVGQFPACTSLDVCSEHIQFPY